MGSLIVKYKIKGLIMILEGYSSMSYCWGRFYLILKLNALESQDISWMSENICNYK